MGLGRYPEGSGISAVQFFARTGAHVVVTDIAKPSSLRGNIASIRRLPNVELVLGRHRKRDFAQCDLVVRNPAVPITSPYLKHARARGVPIETDVGVFLSRTNRRIIGVSGTRGKSTTVTLIAEMLKSRHHDLLVGGNIARSPLAKPGKIRGRGPAVLELSSFMLESLAERSWSPAVAVLTNYFPDHLDRYPSYAAYRKSKEPLVISQRRGDRAMLNYDDVHVRRIAKRLRSTIRWFSMRPLPRGRNGAFIDGRWIVVRDRTKTSRVLPTSSMKLRGAHNVANALAATLVARQQHVGIRRIAQVLRSFRGLPGRLEVVRELHGVTYVNDSNATMPTATRIAVAAFPQPGLLIMGGADKELSYAGMGNWLRTSAVRVIYLLPGSASEKIRKAIGRSVPLVRVKSELQALRRASREANRGDVVLYSPGATSFERYANAYERGDDFRRMVRSLR